MKGCSVSGCTRWHAAKGFCIMHFRTNMDDKVARGRQYRPPRRAVAVAA